MVQPTCWGDCRYCAHTKYAKTHKKPEFRTYRKCQLDDKECFESSLICDRSTFLWPMHATRFKPEKTEVIGGTVLPVGPGWEDF